MNSERVLVLAPSLRDSAVAVTALLEASIEALACEDMGELCKGVQEGCGTVIISEEALAVTSVSLLEDLLRAQEPWSDLPVILLTSNEHAQITTMFADSGNVALLERPFSRQTLVRAAQVALRARRKQYQVSNLLTQLRFAKDEAEKANITKTQFLANMSHEIRTPIGAIIGFSDLIKQPNTPSAERARYTEIINRNSHQLLRLIDDILDLSKVEAGKISIERVSFRLPDLLADLTSIMRFRASEKGVGFKIILDSRIPDVVISDPTRIRQVLSNIVGNAIKFTDSGYVELRVSCSHNVLKFVVKDTGLGLTTDQAEKLFKPFSQADPSTTRKFGGTGLGLVISRELAVSMGGNVTLRTTEVLRGSEFEITILTQPTSETRLVGEDALVIRASREETSFIAGSLDGLNVLLVEDSPDNQMLITRYLKKAGCKVTIARDGVEGSELALNEIFDVILMDIQMPRMDGHTATRNLRDKGFTKPIVALTAHAMQEERIKGMASGFTEFLTKPIQPSILITLLGSFR